MELAEEVESGACSLAAPPVHIFVPLGSGATSVGLMLGCHLLGWPTKVVGTRSQDKNWAARLAVNGDIDTPFLVANARSLLDKALEWLNLMGLVPDTLQASSAQDVLRQRFVYDNLSWAPEYGKVILQIRREATAAADSGLILDNTFTAKSFHTLKMFGEGGMLRKKSALFWNTYQRFPLNTLLPKDPQWIMALPEPIRARVEAYIEMRRGSVITRNARKFVLLGYLAVAIPGIVYVLTSSHELLTLLQSAGCPAAASLLAPGARHGDIRPSVCRHCVLFHCRPTFLFYFAAGYLFGFVTGSVLAVIAATLGSVALALFFLRNHVVITGTADAQPEERFPYSGAVTLLPLVPESADQRILRRGNGTLFHLSCEHRVRDASAGLLLYLLCQPAERSDYDSPFCIRPNFSGL